MYLLFSLLYSIVSSKITFWRYKDPILGPRLIPNYLQPTENNVVLSSKTIVYINIKKQLIEYDDGQSKQLLGNSIIYVVQ